MLKITVGTFTLSDPIFFDSRQVGTIELIQSVASQGPHILF
jgi:hypothetical protein